MNKKTDRNPRSTNYSGVVAHIMIAILLILIGGFMLVPGMKFLYFSYVTAGFLLVWGGALAVRFFVKEEYRYASNYDFAVGILILFAGIIVLYRAKDFSRFFLFFIGVLLLIEGVIALQQTVQLLQLRGKLWPVPLIVSVLLIAFSLIPLLDLSKVMDMKGDAFHIFLIVAGGLSIFCQAVVSLRASRFRKEEEKDFWENAKEASEYTTYPGDGAGEKKPQEPQEPEDPIEGKEPEGASATRETASSNQFPDSDHFSEEGKEPSGDKAEQDTREEDGDSEKD